MEAIKKPTQLKFRITDVEVPVDTLEGPVVAPAGAAILSGTKGEQWPIPGDVFRRTYELDLARGLCAKKPLVVHVECMDAAFEVKVAWSTDLLKGKPGDYRITYGPGDYGIVDAAVFAETYVILDEVDEASEHPGETMTPM
jgi:hypothetical protein